MSPSVARALAAGSFLLGVGSTAWAVAVLVPRHAEARAAAAEARTATALRSAQDEVTRLTARLAEPAPPPPTCPACPECPASPPPAVPRPPLPVISFASASARLGDAARAELDRVIGLLRADAALSLRVEGHTDSHGSEEKNLELAQLRARAVVRYLRNNGVDPQRVELAPAGVIEPPDAVEDEAALARHRRVELTWRP